VRAGGSLLGILFTLFLARVASLVLHFVLAAPSGARVAEHPFRLLPAALAGEIGTLAALGALAGVLSWLSARAGLLFLAGGGAFILALSQLDLELVRWTGEHLNAQWIGVYDPTGDPKILHDVVTGDTRAFVVAVFLVLVPAATAFALARHGERARASGRTVALCAAGAVAGIAAMPLLAPSAVELRRARPGLVGIAAELVAPPGGLSPRDVRQGLAMLDRFLGRPPGWFGDAGYPVWHAAPDEDASYAAFRARPPERRPDILLVILESARGWELDERHPGVAERAPELHRLWRERGVAFPVCIATGYPSIEGLGGILLGIPGHPTRLLLDAVRRKRVLSLPDVLRRAGYRRELVTGTSAAFEGLEDWYARWFEAVRYDASLTTDDDLARRAVERLEAHRDAPLFLTLMTVATHPPLFRPPGADPKTPRDAYLAALGYTDRALGRVFESLRRTPRGRDTLVVVVGDHSTTNPWQSIRIPRLGTPNAGENWTTLLVAGPGLPAGAVRQELASQLDVPPTLLGFLGLDVSNHFFGRDLFARGAPAPQGVLALRLGGLAAFEGPYLLQTRLDAPAFQQKWRWEDYEETPDAENGGYHHGTPQELSAADRSRIEELKTMARAWGAVLDGNRVMPPGADRPFGGAARGATPGP
jgi:arylsulfatase A-like enzyme